jgi:GT2 family glycosyltransferase
VNTRPAVSVVVPFAGADAQLDRLAGALDRLELAPDDELIVADNRPRPRAGSRGRIAIHPASGTRTPGFARNGGVSRARNDWLVFIDADTCPAPALLDAYFDPPPQPGTAVLAGGVEDRAEVPTLAARYGLARSHMSQETTLGRGRWSYAQTANCAVRRDAFEQVGGFDPAARAGEDADLCFRLAQQGWGIEQRPAAAVAHAGRETLPALVHQLAIHGSGTAWCERRHPGSFPPPRAAELLRRLAHSVREAGEHTVSGEREKARFALLDLLGATAFELGRLLPNERPQRFQRSRAG